MPLPPQLLGSPPNTPLDCNTMYGHAKYTGKTHDSSFLLFIPIRSSSRKLQGLLSLRAKWVDADRSQLETRTEPVKEPKDISIGQLVCFLASFHVIQFRGSASTLVNRDNGAVKQQQPKNRRHLLRLTFNWPFTRKKPGSILPFFKTKKTFRHTMAPPHHMERRCTRSQQQRQPSSTRSCHRRSMSFLPLCYLIAAVSCCWTTPVGAGWQDDIQPRRSITLGKLTPPFLISTHFFSFFFLGSILSYFFSIKKTHTHTQPTARSIQQVKTLNIASTPTIEFPSIWLFLLKFILQTHHEFFFWVFSIFSGELVFFLLFIPPGFLLVLNRRKQVMTSFFLYPK